MKVIQSVQAIYEEQQVLSKILQARVDDIINRVKKETWHYFSRTKQLESFALKLETGRVADPSRLEDFFACTLVVENLDQVKKAQSIIEENFTIKIQRPQDAAITHKEPSSFQFDDLRLYVTLKTTDYMPAEPLSEILFEIQVKTFLQHAWTLATHDLIYKADEINWSKERIAYQIKAMLEQAEVVISGVQNLMNVPEVVKENKETTEQKEILVFYHTFFSKEELPEDLVRLCKTTWQLLGALRITIKDVAEILTKENEAGRGTHFKNLSPFLLIIQSIINQRKDLIQQYVNRDKPGRFKIMLPREIQAEALTIRQHHNIMQIKDTPTTPEVMPEQEPPPLP